MQAASGRRKLFYFLPLSSAAMLLIGVRLVIHGDTVETICGGAILISAILSLIGWVLAICARTR
jgi:hypothetical protein